MFKGKYLVILRWPSYPYTQYIQQVHISVTERKEKHDLGRHTERLIEDWYYVHKYLHLSLI